MYLRFIDCGCNVVVSIIHIPMAFYTGIAATEGIDYVGSETFTATENFCLESGYLLPACCFHISTLFLYPILSFPTSAWMCAQNSYGLVSSLCLLSFYPKICFFLYNLSFPLPLLTGVRQQWWNCISRRSGKKFQTPGKALQWRLI